jgi:serine/threonine protein kinase
VNEWDRIEIGAGALLLARHLEGWRVETIGNGRGFWSVYEPLDLPTRQDSGFKIHVSASVTSADEVLARTIPILHRMGIPFKHAATLQHLAFLSSGRGGQTQVGKFLTAYPPDPKRAFELAHLLHEATVGLNGPQIPSEPSLFPGSLVHYRYGSFSQRWLQLPTGRIVHARAGIHGVETDLRDAGLTDQGGLDDPFTGLKHVQLQHDVRVLRDRYVRVQRLHQSPKGSTWLGFDQTHDDDFVVIKEAYAFVMEGSDGLDARQRLRRESQCLRYLAPTGLTPVVKEYWEESKSAFLIYRHIPGPTFASILNALAAEGVHPTCDLLRHWMGILATSVATVHQHGYVIGDIKPDNLIFTGEAFHFIDLETAGPPTAEPTGCIGTRGYCSPQQSDPQSGRSYLDDVYAIGATMISAATLSDATILPDCLTVARLEASRHPAEPSLLAIERCLAHEPDQRFPSAAAIVDYCHAPSHAPSYVSVKRAAEWRGRIDAAVDFVGLACEVGDTVIRDAIREGDHAYWVSHHPTALGNPARDIYVGSAGTALFLCGLFDTTKAARYLDIAIECGEWLWNTEPIVPRQVAMPGLYFGECGPGLLYLKLYQSSGDDEWLSRAHAVSERVSRIARHSPDIMTGAAGTGLFHLALWHLSADEAVLRRATDEAQALLETRAKSRPTWIIPPDHETLSGNEYIGFSHGSAGIGYFLTEVCLARHDVELADCCVDIAGWILAQSRPSLHDGSGLTWSVVPDGSGGDGSYWCHGSAGIARFLVRAYDLSNDLAYLRAAEQAGRMLAIGATWYGTTQCHGLAGNADVLVDIWRRAAGPHLDAARALGQNLAIFRTKDGWPSESPNVFSADLMVGQAGVGAAFLRLGNPQLPHLVSTEAFAGGMTH